MIGIEETLCWQCSKTYPIEAEKCPYCGAANGNVDLEKAQAEQLHDFARKMRNAPDPLRKCKHGRVYNGTTCPDCRDEFKAHMNEGVQIPTLEPIDGNWSNTALENWFPYSAEELGRLKRENALLARALAKEVNAPTFMGEPVISEVVVPREIKGEMLAEMWRAVNGHIGGHDHESLKYVWRRTLAAARTFKSCDSNGDWHEFPDQSSATNKTECSECPTGNCPDCPRKPAHHQWEPV